MCKPGPAWMCLPGVLCVCVCVSVARSVLCLVSPCPSKYTCMYMCVCVCESVCLGVLVSVRVSLCTHVYKTTSRGPPLLPRYPPPQAGLSFLLRWQHPVGMFSQPGPWASVGLMTCAVGPEWPPWGRHTGDTLRPSSQPQALQEPSIFLPVTPSQLPDPAVSSRTPP